MKLQKFNQPYNVFSYRLEHSNILDLKIGRMADSELLSGIVFHGMIYFEGLILQFFI